MLSVIQHNVTYAKCLLCYCIIYAVFLMLSVAMKLIMLSVVMLNVVMLSVLAPFIVRKSKKLRLKLVAM